MSPSSAPWDDLKNAVWSGVRGRGQIELTEAGRQMASLALERHQLVESFLLKLGVSESSAAADAEGIEHHLGEETLKAMRRFLEE